MTYFGYRIAIIFVALPPWRFLNMPRPARRSPRPGWRHLRSRPIQARTPGPVRLDPAHGWCHLPLCWAGAHDQAAALASRAAAHAALDNPGGVAVLLDSLRQAGARDQAAALASRAAAHAALDDPGGVAWLLRSLRAAGADEQAAALLARDPAAHALDNPGGVGGVGFLLSRLREAGAHDQAAALTERLPAAGMFGLFLEQQGHEDQFRFGQQADGSPAAPWGWDDLD